jgi:hypothetical protein
VTRPLRRATAAGLALLLVAAGLVGFVWWRHAQRSDLATALTLVPDDVQRYSWTDWAGVRRELDMPDRADPSAAQVTAFLSKGFDADLTSASAMVTSAETLQARLGLSPATVAWELFAQSESGAVVVVEPSSTDGLERAIEAAGYTERDGIWDGSAAVARLGITPEFGYLAVRDGRVYGSDSADYLDEVLGGGFSPAEPVAQVVDAVGEPVSAVAYSGDYACAHLAMSQADDVDQAQAGELIRQAGGVDPLTAFAMGVSTGGSGRGVTVALGFDSHDRAVHNADARAALASGAAPGQGGEFADRFRLGRVEAVGEVVTMRLHPVTGAYVLSDLSTGPVLFASC